MVKPLAKLVADLNCYFYSSITWGSESLGTSKSCFYVELLPRSDYGLPEHSDTKEDCSEESALRLWEIDSRLTLGKDLGECSKSL